MKVLVDTCVWIDHFKNTNHHLVNLLQTDQCLTHPFIIAEIACGTPPEPRKQTISDISLLQSSNQATLVEVVDFIEKEKLYGLGCGLIDISLLASTLVTPDAQLWTLDKRLLNLAQRFNRGYQTMKAH